MKSFFISRGKLMSLLSFIGIFILCFIYYVNYFKTVKVYPYSKYEIRNCDSKRREFIESFDIELSEEKCKKEKFLVPSSFDKNMDDLEKIINDMGMSFIPYKGATLNKYTYFVKNTENIVYVELYIINSVVAGAVLVNPDLRSGYIVSLADCKIK